MSQCDDDLSSWAVTCHVQQRDTLAATGLHDAIRGRFFEHLFQSAEEIPRA